MLFAPPVHAQERDPIGLDLTSVQAGITTDGVVKDRIIVDANMYDFARYKGLHEGFQAGGPFFDNLYFRNEVLVPGIGFDHVTPVSIIKLNEEEGDIRLKDFKVGVGNTSIPELLGGTGKIYLTTDMEEITGLFSYERNLPRNFAMEITGEATFGPERPSLYIEGELQRHFNPGVYLFTRGEIDNQGKENRLVLGIGYKPGKN